MSPPSLLVASEVGRWRRAAGSTGGVSLALSAVPPPEHLGPIGTYLSGEDFSAWSRGQIMFSNGGEVAWVVPPRLLEVAPTSDVKSLSSLLDALGPAVLQSGDDRPVDGFAQLECGREIVVGHVDGGIQQPALNRPVRQQFRLGQQLLARAVPVLHGADKVEALPATQVDESHE